MQTESTKINLCFDTNIVIELKTIVDLNRAASSSRIAAAYLLEYRRRRSQATLSAARLCHLRKLSVWCLKDEGLEKIVGKESETGTVKQGLAPPGTPDGLNVWFYLYFLKDHVLPGLHMPVFGESRFSDKDLGGNGRDRLIVEIAKEFNVPVVTHEFRLDGAVAKKAKELSVTTMSAADWISSQGADLTTLSNDLLGEAREKMLLFMIDRPRWSRVFEENCRLYVEMLAFILRETEAENLSDPMDGWGRKFDLSRG
jgi:hypothetical protein